MLNVYRFYWDKGGYGSGVMLIAATSENKAKSLCKDENLPYFFDYEMTNLKWHGEEGIILEEHYQE